MSHLKKKKPSNYHKFLQQNDTPNKYLFRHIELQIGKGIIRQVRMYRAWYQCKLFFGKTFINHNFLEKLYYKKCFWLSNIKSKQIQK